MYKDKDKQREVGKERVRRYRDRQKGVTLLKGVTTGNVTPAITLSNGVKTLTETNVISNALPPDDELFAGLPDALRLYANSELGGTWYRQQIQHLKTTPIEQLQAEAADFYVRPFIPCWRYNMETA